MDIEIKDRYLGCLLGLACGDAAGTTVEFKDPGTFPPVTDMVGGGPFGLPPGAWTDDTSMALCLAESLVESGGFDPRDQMERYIRWYREGRFSSTGRCFDIGSTTRGALENFLKTGEPYSGSDHPRSAGNGSIMRLAPVPMCFAGDMYAVAHYSGESSRTTHGAAEAVDACKLFGVIIALALAGKPKESILFETSAWLNTAALSPRIAAIAQGEYKHKSIKEIRGSGYVVDSLEAALWSFWHTASFEQAVLTAVNLGRDADTTAAVVGQVAGAFYGIRNIPPGWLQKLVMRQEIESLAAQLWQQNKEHRLEH
ncbi:MAG: ADP-ribosylglycohydrolase family protein [Anaerolineales bacterium]|nr:ADP-ribosylglycohydrolase family protein [Anaerolineales bacterium]